jgi:hypothetical protein
MGSNLCGRGRSATKSLCGPQKTREQAKVQATKKKVKRRIPYPPICFVIAKEHEFEMTFFSESQYGEAHEQ